MLKRPQQQVGHEFSSVEALWSQFENVMGKDGEDEGEESGKQPEGEEDKEGQEEHREEQSREQDGKS